jgi:rubrerythrin
MNILDFALQMEKDGEVFYTKLSEKLEDRSLKNIFSGLAEDEKSHYVKILEMGKTSQVLNSSELNIGNVFEVQDSDDIDELIKDQIKAYTVAMFNEEKSMNLYKSLSEKSNDASEKIFFLQLWEEEQEHYEQLETIIYMIQQGKDWVESAEFNKTEDY